MVVGHALTQVEQARQIGAQRLGHQFVLQGALLGRQQVQEAHLQSDQQLGIGARGFERCVEQAGKFAPALPGQLDDGIAGFLGLLGDGDQPLEAQQFDRGGHDIDWRAAEGSREQAHLGRKRAIGDVAAGGKNAERGQAQGLGGHQGAITLHGRSVPVGRRPLNDRLATGLAGRHSHAMSDDPLAHGTILPEPDLPNGGELLATGRVLARDWQVGTCAFLEHHGVASEAVFKRDAVTRGMIMRHAQIGFRDIEKTRRCYHEIWERCASAGARVDRYGMTLDWAMGYPLAMRDSGPRGTGMWLKGAEDFVAVTARAPVAPHFGDWMLGFPGALTNTQWALAAGSTAIGNLGQLFTFRLPGWDDDIACVAETVKALGLIAAQPVEVLVHANLDDGFAATFQDLACCLGAALIERHIVEDLIGAPMAHCYGHHFSEPVARLAFHLALSDGATAPGSMIYGNTTSYRGEPAQNWASLASYLLADIMGQRLAPTGHAINPVPITEGSRIPDIDEIVEAQLFADRLIGQAEGLAPLIDPEPARLEAARIVAGGRAFRDAVLGGLADRGYDTTDPFVLFLALRRIGAARLETAFGPGIPVAASPVRRELDAMAGRRLEVVDTATRAIIAGADLTALIATSDVHEHGKTLLETMCRELGVAVVDGGVSVDPDDLARRTAASGCDLVCISTYNGIALDYVESFLEEARARGVMVPVLVGGRLNQIPGNTNTSLPVDVGDALGRLGVAVCRDAADLVPALLDAASGRQP